MKYGIVFGGNSYEHEISIVSAVVMKKILEGDLSFIFCDSKRDFYLIEAKDMNAKTFASGAYTKAKKLYLNRGGFYEKGFLGEKKLDVTTYINLIHGSDGEDGKLAGLFEFFGLEFIGARLEASVLSFNKALTKLYAQKVGVKTLPYQVLRANEDKKEFIFFPCIIKPVRLGSSIGISVARDEKELEYAKDVGFEFDNELLIEPFKENIAEFNLAGCKIKDEFVFSMIEEPKKKELLDFEQKYLSFSNSNEVSEAKLSEELKNKLKEAFKQIYEGTFEGALIRCDFFVLDNEVYLNEINPHPGSMANYLFKDFNAVLEGLASNLPKQKKIEVTYNFLHSINGQKGKL